MNKIIKYKVNIEKISKKDIDDLNELGFDWDGEYQIQQGIEEDKVEIYHDGFMLGFTMDELISIEE